MKQYYVYILASKRNGALYIGVTNDLLKRVYVHKNNLIDGFTKKYNINKLVYGEEFSTPEEAIVAEKKIKGWKRKTKIELIKSKKSRIQRFIKKYILTCARDSSAATGGLRMTINVLPS